MYSNFLMGGKLGDFLHAMFAVKHLCLKNNTKANVYMYNIGWEFGIQNTYAELTPIMAQQDYINSLNILTEYELDPIQTPEKNSLIKIYNDKLLSEGYIDLGTYVNSPYIYKTCWSELYSKTFDFSISGEYNWISYDKKINELSDKVLIHRRYNPIRLNHYFPHNQILEEYKDKVIFISSSEKDYKEYGKNIPFLKVSTLDEWFTCINSCSLMVSNLSSPAVIAHAMDKLRIIELPNIIDAAHCIGEEKYSKKIYWYMDEKYNNL
jgi:hypothetical protein